MKSVFKEQVSQKDIYPVLMKHEGTGTVVLLTADTKGTVVVPSSSHSLGEYRSDWSVEKGFWMKVEGTVELSND